MKAHVIRLSAGIAALAAILIAQTAPKRPPRDIMHKPSSAKKAAVDRKIEAVRLNNLGVAYMNQQQFAKALKHFRLAATANSDLFEPKLNQGIALLNMQKPEEARVFLEKATQQKPDSAPVWFNIGLLEKGAGRSKEAIAAFARASELAPEDPEAFYFLGTAESEAGDQQAAIRSLEQSIKLNPFHVSAEFALARAYQRSGSPEEARVHLQRFQQMTQKKLGSPISLIYGEQGKLSLAQQVKLPSAAMTATIPVKFTDVTSTLLGHGPKMRGKTAPSVCAIESGKEMDLLVASGEPHLYHRGPAGAFKDVTANSGIKQTQNAISCAAGDFDNDGHSDLAVSTAEGVVLYRSNGKGGFVDATADSGLRGIAGAVSLTWFDYDHDGDLDLFIAAGDKPSQLWRNNGNGKFTDVTAETGFGVDGVERLIPTDFNNDRAIDAVLVSATKPIQILANPREGKFTPLNAWQSDAPRAAQGVVFDFDQDGTMDLVLAHDRSPALTLWANEKGGKLVERKLPDLHWKRATSVAVFDYDNDGWLDIVAIGENESGKGEIRVLRNLGPDGFRDVTANLGLSSIDVKLPATLTTIDFDSDGDTDLIVTSTDAAPVLFRNDGGNRNHWLRIALRGLNDNKSAIGTKVEVFAGEQWQKWEYTGLTGAGQSSVSFIAGLDGKNQADIVRTLWPTGVLQDEIEIAADTTQDLLEIDRRGSSCPVLFAWDGERYRFIADMIGSGVFGHWVAPGELNVPDPTEYLKLEGVTPALKNGLLSFRFLEPMEETVYVDQLRLLAIDHPSDVDVFPNERFLSAPPYPDFKVIVSRGAKPSAHAFADGKDVTDLLRARDRRYVDGMELLPFRGFTKEHTLELDLGEPYRGGPLRLLMYGYIEYFTATGMFSAHQAGIDPMAPAVDAWVNGKWVRVIDDMGFPAGLRRTIVAELTDKLPAGTEKIRIKTNLQIYWDQVLIDRTPEVPDIRTHDVPLASAKLSFLGYPREVAAESPGDISYVYEEVSKTGPYTRQNGAYTHYGDVTDLLSGSDDKFAVFSSGEEVAVDFDPSGLPKLPAGWKRDYLFFADGYEKDMDFYATDFLSVEPMPFHGMKDYPRDGSHYPSEKNLKYLLERNDRFESTSASGDYRFRFPEPQRPR